MTMFANWAAGLCAAGVACALLRMLCPEGTLNSAMRVATALLFFCCLLSPIGMLRELLADGFADANVSTAQPSYALAERVDDQATAVIEQALLRDATDRLENIAVKRVEILRSSDAAQIGVAVDRVRVVFDKAEHPLNTAEVTILEQAWGIPVEVYYSDAN